MQRCRRRLYLGDLLDRLRRRRRRWFGLRFGGGLDLGLGRWFRFNFRNWRRGLPLHGGGRFWFRLGLRLRLRLGRRFRFRFRFGLWLGFRFRFLGFRLGLRPGLLRHGGHHQVHHHRIGIALFAEIRHAEHQQGQHPAMQQRRKDEGIPFHSRSSPVRYHLRTGAVTNATLRKPAALIVPMTSITRP